VSPYPIRIWGVNATSEWPDRLSSPHEAVKRDRSGENSP
jgi:hypothetical protein